MECSRCNSRDRGGGTSKWQWVNLKFVSFRSGFRIHNVGLLTSQASKRYILNFASCLISHAFLPSFLLHNGHFSSSKLMISLSCLSLLRLKSSSFQHTQERKVPCVRCIWRTCIKVSRIELPKILLDELGPHGHMRLHFSLHKPKRF
ncbi:hypothetical protein AAG906_007645 [Vitis piasezkii]